MAYLDRCPSSCAHPPSQLSWPTGVEARRAGGSRDGSPDREDSGETAGNCVSMRSRKSGCDRGPDETWKILLGTCGRMCEEWMKILWNSDSCGDDCLCSCPCLCYHCHDHGRGPEKGLG